MTAANEFKRLSAMRADDGFGAHLLDRDHNDGDWEREDKACDNKHQH